MATYAIGDVQGCYAELVDLLATFNYNPDKDKLWFAGDLVNRGPESLKVLRHIKALPNTVVVLGNHDWHLLTLTRSTTPPTETLNHTMDDILNAEDREELLDWLTEQKMAHFDEHLNVFMSHAGLPPGWSATQALGYAQEIETLLTSNQLGDLLDVLYGDEPDLWSEQLTGFDRARYIVNALCRMRYLDPTGRLILEVKGKPQNQPPGHIPWFNAEQTQFNQTRVLFGHWASLEGVTHHPQAIALDTGCVWGRQLSALRLEDGAWFRVKSTKNKHEKNK